ncbi:MAG: relaxase/mobilization nuclease domain-containing protein [Bacilli bacterium]|nr:relaxase/mobilization nuclease domain-containing protein [Bacilli bacterium]
MATTKIWKFKSRVDTLINYAINGEKTEEKLYVSGVNCMPDTAYVEMTNVKKQFFKTDGIQCFHGYQSFAEGEVTPAQAHEISVKLAEELWGDRFQVVVSTHLNTDNIHSHFVVNSVSFVDGKRFNNTKKDYAMMRKISDRLCEEYGLSVLKKEEKYDKYANSSVYKELMKDSIDYAIENANNFADFVRTLEDLDYIITEINGELSIRREPYKRNTRIERQFGKNYSKDMIIKRMIETQPNGVYKIVPYILTRAFTQKYKQFKEINVENLGFLGTLLFKGVKVPASLVENAVNSNLRTMTPELIKATKKMDEYSKQARFLAKYKIESEEQLIEFEKNAYKKVKPCKSERENLWRTHKRAKTEDEKQIIEEMIADISKQIIPVDEELRICRCIMKRNKEIRKTELRTQLEKEKVILLV